MRINQKGFSIIEMFVVFAVLGLVVGAGWLFVNRQNELATSKLQNNTNESVPKTVQLQPEAIITKIRSEYASRYTVVEDFKPQSGQVQMINDEISPAYKVEGYNYYTNYEGGSSLSLQVGPVSPGSDLLPRDIDIEVRKEIADIYKSFGLVLKETHGDKSVGNTADMYVGQGIVCETETPTAPTSATSATCGLIKHYAVATEKVKPFAAVLPDVNESTYFVGLKISKSKTPGYQKAQVSQQIIGVSGSVALLYQKGSDDWRYFRHTQQAIECSEYNTVDLRNAFKGDVCSDGTGENSTVQ